VGLEIFLRGLEKMSYSRAEPKPLLYSMAKRGTPNKAILGQNPKTPGGGISQKGGGNPKNTWGAPKKTPKKGGPKKYPQMGGGGF